MIGLPPGTILQSLYLREQLTLKKKQGKKKFIEVGAGNGFISKIFLDLGFEGCGYDLNISACENNRSINSQHTRSGKYKVFNKDFIDDKEILQTDIVISCMVIEHLPNEKLSNYIDKCKKVLKEEGTIILIVPASMNFWGIEDEIAGHIKRYEFVDIRKIADQFDLKIVNIRGLTYPLSNILFQLSNSLVKKNESEKLKLSQQERTVYTGNRKIKYKTEFPKLFNVILNPITMYPFHFLQKMFSQNENSMVIYAELGKTIK